MVRWRSGEPLRNTMTDSSGGKIKLANGSKEASNMVIQDLLGRRWRVSVVADEDATSLPLLCPSFPVKVAIASADGVGMQTEAPGQLPGAGETVARLEVAAKNGKHNLSDELPIDRNFAARGKPESHAWPQGKVIGCS